MILSFRPAGAADADAAVPLIYSSGPATFDYVFAPAGADQALRFLHAAFRGGRGEFGHLNHVVALADGAIVGVGAAWDGRATLRFTLAAAAQILRFYGPVGAAGVIARGLAVERVIRPPRGDELYVAHLGVREDCRGRGVGAALTRHLLGCADRARHRIASLDVAVTNPRAEALYARLGFSVLALRRSGLARGDSVVPDHRRMTLALA
ncbi:MAG TPA: GNAT family N-acetyltransferase [Steroidobacteraceae bacterium]|nr:GNAT family N-acetyltransferase [Steroidobacteraceae bacterium]